MKTFNHNGLRIKDDGYLEICHNNQRSAALSAANLMHLPNPPTAIFCSTFELLISMIDAPDSASEAESVLVMPERFIRESCCPIKQQAPGQKTGLDKLNRHVIS